MRGEENFYESDQGNENVTARWAKQSSGALMFLFGGPFKVDLYWVVEFIWF